MHNNHIKLDDLKVYGNAIVPNIDNVYGFLTSNQQKEILYDKNGNERVISTWTKNEACMKMTLKQWKALDCPINFNMRYGVMSVDYKLYFVARDKCETHPYESYDAIVQKTYNVLGNKKDLIYIDHDRVDIVSLLKIGAPPLEWVGTNYYREISPKKILANPNYVANYNQFAEDNFPRFTNNDYTYNLYLHDLQYQYLAENSERYIRSCLEFSESKAKSLDYRESKVASQIIYNREHKREYANTEI